MMITTPDDNLFPHILSLHYIYCKKTRVVLTGLPVKCFPMQLKSDLDQGQISKAEAHGGPGTCNPRTSGTCSAKREGATRAHLEK